MISILKGEMFYTCANLGTSLRVTTCSGIGRPHSPLGHSLASFLTDWTTLYLYVVPRLAHV